MTLESIPCDLCVRERVFSYSDPGVSPSACAQRTNPLCGEGTWDRYLGPLILRKENIENTNNIE